ncbi:hypothetical protein Patl1_20785 [Pistacia atlantica]|uniref:Uncharacterized protein n=1 Tax=Pistacia atlantica TaxID=434234 RepID=A0ACC1BNQ1_9ROSI|nr:hypothetical protein Patl1_20785 [Pistacia atlantica]
MLSPSAKPRRGKCTTAAMDPDIIKDVEIAISCREGRTYIVASDVAFPKGKENLASVLKRYKRRLANKPISSHDTSGSWKENIFEWQFAIRGPHDTEFEGGIYHERIQLPAEYPFKPPSFMLLTPNGRFETRTKICLSISNNHPKHWQPS